MHAITRRSLLGGASSLAVLGTTGLSAASARAKPKDKKLSSARLPFDADFPRNGYQAYWRYQPAAEQGVPGVQQGLDYGLVDDPLAPGPGRTVMWMDSSRGYNIGTPYPRVEALTDPWLVQSAHHGNTNDEYWAGWSFLIPSSSPLVLNEGEDYAWCTLMSGGYGAPYGGPGTLSVALNLTGGVHHLTFGSWSWLQHRVPLIYDQWMNVMIHYKVAYQGWVELYTSVGRNNADYVQQPLKDGLLRVPLDVLRVGVNDAFVNNYDAGALYSSIGVYGSQPMRAYFAHHRVAHTRAEAMPIDRAFR